MTMQTLTADVLVIGGGISGLMAALQLQNAGVRVAVLDKGRSVGGRMATRRVGTGAADHGAQFFTARSEPFHHYINQWIADGVVFEWSRGFGDGSLSALTNDGHPRYAVRGGMNALAKHIAKGLEDVRTRMKIVTVTGDDQGWILQDEEGRIFSSQAVVLTAPVPQSLELLNEGATVLETSDYEALQRITYAENLTGLFWVKGAVKLPSPGAIQRRNANIAWVSDNQQKGISPNATIITVQASDQYSRQMWSAPDDRIMRAFRMELQLFLGEDVKIEQAQLKRWRYSRPLVTYSELFLQVKMPMPLIFAGDAFGGARLEGAFLSGIAAGQALAEMVK